LYLFLLAKPCLFFATSIKRSRQQLALNPEEGSIAVFGAGVGSVQSRTARPVVNLRNRAIGGLPVLFEDQHPCYIVAKCPIGADDDTVAMIEMKIFIICVVI